MENSLYYLVDETAIVSAHDKIISRDGDLILHLDLINAALNLLSTVPNADIEQQEFELLLLRNVVRCFNSGAASLLLLRRGYFQPAIAMVRDVMETALLFELFKREAGSLQEWRDLKGKEHWKRFSPAAVRKRIEIAGGKSAEAFERRYKLLSQHAAHVDPDGHHLISPGGLTQIGPFANAAHLKAAMEELALQLGHTAMLIVTYLPLMDEQAKNSALLLRKVSETWQGRFKPLMMPEQT